MDVLFSYSFKIIAIGTILLASLASLVGIINVYKDQSLIGDAMGHSTYAGLVLAFILTGMKSSWVLLIGACLSAALSYFLIEYSSKNTKIGPDANMAIYLSGFFGLGLVFKSYIQGNPAFASSRQAGLDNYIFGQAAYLLEDDIWLIGGVLLIALIIFALNYRHIKAYLFDPEFAYMVNINTKILDSLVLFITILTIGVGIKAVGVILIASFMVLPTLAASKLSHSFGRVLAISIVISALSAFIGSYISTIYSGFSTGPTIIIIQASFAILAQIIKILRRK
ncbi:metal ABC transporter permease [uncultured Anaerococcus sp.]|uniref:metal ABC transporter permease n=1 Tax=uncultured Anaerococcus sp. TaxID=293428 RepID=UPI0028890F8D|nr:metal ABC transporter permease [uncultured Anaerococcus sp.]